jgi:RNA polymerase sigma factor (TIGR02999 family)
MQDSPGEVTLLLAKMRGGNSEALPKLIPLVYDELRRLAAYFLREEREGHTLQPTALVHEAYLRLAGQKAGWRNRAQFMGVAAQLMRRILVDCRPATPSGRLRRSRSPPGTGRRGPHRRRTPGAVRRGEFRG